MEIVIIILFVLVIILFYKVILLNKHLTILSFSEENKQIIDEHFEGHKIDGDGIDSALIKIPVNEKTIITELEKKSLELVNKLKKQPLTWTRVFTFEEAAKQITGDVSKCSLGDAEKYFYHDKESDLFFLSKEHYEKLKESEEEYLLSFDRG